MTEIYSVLITGARKGIGLEFVKQFLTNKSVKPHIIIATCRNPETATVSISRTRFSEIIDFRLHIIFRNINITIISSLKIHGTT